MIDLSDTTPTMLPEQMRAASKDALARAADPLSRLDNNPYIADEWAVVSSVLWGAAATLDQRLMSVFQIGGSDGGPVV